MEENNRISGIFCPQQSWSYTGIRMKNSRHGHQLQKGFVSQNACVFLLNWKQPEEQQPLLLLNITEKPSNHNWPQYNLKEEQSLNAFKKDVKEDSSQTDILPAGVCPSNTGRYLCYVSVQIYKCSHVTFSQTEFRYANINPYENN